jgi:hypothetical protein
MMRIGLNSGPVVVGSKGEFKYLEGRCLKYGGSMVYLPISDIL